MNYDRALKTLEHARTGKRLPKKKLENATWLHEIVSHGGTGGNLVDLVLFDKHILTWYPNGSIALDNKGYWSWSTKDRFNKYMPSGFRIWQTRPFWFIKTPSAVLPYRNGMHLDANGMDATLPLAMHDGSAVTLQERIHKYALLYANRLVNGIIPKDQELDCKGCALASEIDRPFMNHIYDHVTFETTPASLIEQALHSEYFRRNQSLPLRLALDIVDASWHENQIIWRRPKSQKAAIARVEAMMLSEKLPRLDIVPRTYVTHLTSIVENFILDVLGFQRMED